MRLRPALAALSILVLATSTPAGGWLAKAAKAVGGDELMFILGDHDAEVRVGSQVAATYKAEARKNPAPAALNDYIQGIFQRLLAKTAGKYPYSITVQMDDTVNAYALPGGAIFIYKGMIDLCQSDHEIAAVLGHEIGHVVFRHGMQRMRRDLGLRTAIQGLLSDHGNMAKLAQVGASFRGLSFGRVHEDESDAFGMELAYQAGFDPSGAPNLWKRMQEKFGSGSGIQGYLSTHPSNEARINNTLAWLKRKGVPYRQTGGGKSYTGP